MLFCWFVVFIIITIIICIIIVAIIIIIIIIIICKRELEYRIARFHSLVNSRRPPETFGDLASCRYSWKAVSSRLLP